MIGIYKITNPKGKIYIGQSQNIEKRILTYKKLACKDQPKIYYSLQKYGAENHLFEIIEECNLDELNKKERYYQQIYNCIGKNGLNCKITNENDFNGVFCDETKLKMSNSAKLKNFSFEHRNNMSKNRKGEKNGMYGKTHNLVSKLKMSNSKLNMSEESRKKYSEYSKNRTPEHRMKLSESHKGKKPVNTKLVLNIITGIYYESIKEAANTFPNGKGSRTLHCKLSGKRRNNTNFILV